jgi:hypothetical protein
MMSRQSRAVQTFSYPVTLVPAVFVLTWSTGFIVARYWPPYSLPQKFFAMRYAISEECLLGLTVVAGATWPMNRTQWMHLCVVGVLMQAIYLGGAWAAVKAGMGAPA